MRAYVLAEELPPDAWEEAQKLKAGILTHAVAGQLYAAIGSIHANIGEGYSRSSGRDRARIFEYALGSVRESMSWYRAGAPVPGKEVAANRLDRLEEMRRLLLAIIPRERACPRKK